MEPFLLKNDKNLFYNYLDNINIYFEYGSGEYIAILKNIKTIYSVESDITGITN